MPRRTSPARRWCIPPAMLRGPGETLEGIKILVEVPGELGVLLWRICRDVSLWADVEPESRGGLFAAESADVRLARLAATEVPAPITAAVDTLSSMLTNADRADAEVMTNCCLEVAAWARGERLVHTAVAFAQAGALASPEYGEAALHTGIAAAEAGEDTRATTWLRRALGLSRRGRDGVTYAAALVELAAISERAGDVHTAGDTYQRAYRAGRRVKGDATGRMRAAHGLFRLARQRGDESAAALFSVAAARAYRRNAAHGLPLLLDLARYWTDTGKMGRARVALRKLSVRRKELSPRDQLSFAALVARAFAQADRGYSAAAAVEAWQLLTNDVVLWDDALFTAVRDLAHAARMHGDRPAFARAQREGLRRAPTEAYSAVARELADVWPPEESV